MIVTKRLTIPKYTAELNYAEMRPALPNPCRQVQCGLGNTLSNPGPLSTVRGTGFLDNLNVAMNAAII